MDNMTVDIKSRKHHINSEIARKVLLILVFVLTIYALFSFVGFAKNTVYATNKTRDEGINWLKSQVGKSIDMDGAPPYPYSKYQCVDLAKAYYQYLGVSPVWGNGCDYERNPLPAGWKRVIGGNPQRGDIVFYGPSAGNQYGHVAIYESDHVTFHQNYAGHPRVERITNMIYYGFREPYRGYIRPNWRVPVVDQAPTGEIKTLKSAPGMITVTGTAYDPDNTGKNIDVHIYMDAPSGGNAKCIGRVTANGPNHSFSISIDIRKYPVGKHKIYAYGLNINKSGVVKEPHVQLKGGGKTVDFLPEIIYTVNTGEATKINNTSATISGSLSPAGTTTQWGFYCGTSETDMSSHKYTVATSTTDSSKMSAVVNKYLILTPGTKYYYKVWAKVNDTIKTGTTATFSTTAVKPEIPVVKVSSRTKEIGISDSVEFSWNATEQTDYYKLHLFNEEGEEVSISEKITGTTYAIKAIDKAGTYTVSVASYNTIGSKGLSEPASFVVHPDVTATFMDAESFVDVGDDYEQVILAQTKAHWGHDVELPASPQHAGYTFNKWAGDYTDLKEDTTLTAVYDINQYTVRFIDPDSNDVMKTEKVDYYSSANPPDYPVEDGYAKLGYSGWDKAFDHITEDTTLYKCIGWYDDEMPVFVRITNAVREYDSESSGDEGYTVTLSIRNWDTSTTKGRAVVALKTREGKLLTSTESAAFSIKSSATKELEVFVPYENAASIAEAYVIGQYKDAVPISTTQNATYEIDQTNTLTNWSTEKYPEGASHAEQRTEYRYRDKITTTSYETSLAGYTQNGSSWVKSGSGTIDYISSFPSGFSKSHSLYTKYHKSPATAYENATAKRTVSTSTIGYMYWHWCRNNASTPGNYLISDCYTSEFNTCHAFVSSGTQSYNSSAKAHYCVNAGACKTTYWWMGKQICTSTNIPVYRCSYTDYKKQFKYYKWSDWSEWSTDVATQSDNKDVQTRIVYRYQPDEAMQEDTSGEQRTVSGTVDHSFAGKEASLFIYKINEASDFTNEYVGQTIIDDDGSYEFSFKLREEPSIETGDLTVALGIQGTTTPIFLESIEAPKKQYTVKFFDYDGKLLSTETVNEHDNAPVPDEDDLQREGYTFAKWSDTNMNVTEDRELYAEYKINTYNVVFVDWQAKKVSVEKFDYGATLIAPQPEEPEEGKTVEWDAIADGVQTVTEDLIVTTRYADKELDVTILDDNNNVAATKTVKYGMAVELPDKTSTEKKVFQGWQDISDGEEIGIDDTIITKNSILCPVYHYTETVEDPVADIESGVYNKKQYVTLSCDTAGADIFYTLDGSDPSDLGAKLYSEPIEIDDAVELKFYASKAEMNNSAVQSRLYSVNYNGAKSKWMTYNELPQDVKDNSAAYDLEMLTGYRFRDVKSVTTVSEAAALELSGWITDGDAEESYTEYSDWSNEMPQDTGDYIGLDIDTQPVYTAANQYKYSHYVYEDGITKYSPSEVDGFDCTYEETEPFDQPLKVAGFTGNGIPFFSYDGQMWYDQQEIAGEVLTGSKYRYRLKKVEYTKWSDWTTERPGVTEQRETETANVYSYVRHNNYIVTIHFGDEEWSYLAEEGSKVSLDFFNDYSDFYENPVLYTDKQCTNEWDIEEDTVTQSVDLTVKADKRVFTVTFLDEDYQVLKEQEVELNESAEPPAAPEIDGKVFLYWSNPDYDNVTYNVDTIAVYVPEDEYATVALDNDNINLFKNKSIDLTAIVSPDSKSDTELTWTSSDESVACVSDTGKVIGLEPGIATITVMVNETKETATCQVTVKADGNNDLILMKNDKLSVDEFGYLRGVKAGKDKVSDIIKYFDNADVVCVDADGEAVEPDAFVGTGFSFRLVKGTIVKDEMPVVVTGDINGDGELGGMDITMILQSLIDKVELDDAQILAANVNGDQWVNVRDALLLSRVLVDKEQL